MIEFIFGTINIVITIISLNPLLDNIEPDKISFSRDVLTIDHQQPITTKINDKTSHRKVCKHTQQIHRRLSKEETPENPHLLVLHAHISICSFPLFCVYLN